MTYINDIINDVKTITSHEDKILDIVCTGSDLEIELINQLVQVCSNNTSDVKILSAIDNTVKDYLNKM